MAGKPRAANSTLGRVFPTRPAPRLPDKDARHYALERFRLFLSYLDFHRTGAPGETSSFRIPIESIFLAEPDNLEDAKLPAISLIPAMGEHSSYGLGPTRLLEGTFNVYAEDTALARLGDYTEVIGVEVWGAKIAERRSIVAGLKTVLRLSDSSYALQLKLPDYYDRIASFALEDSTYIEDGAALNRRRAHLFVRLQVSEVQLVNVNTLSPVHTLATLDGGVYETLDSPVPSED